MNLELFVCAYNNNNLHIIYVQVIEYEPTNASARLTLHNILLKQSPDAALQVLCEDCPPYNSQVILLLNCSNLIER